MSLNDNQYVPFHIIYPNYIFQYILFSTIIDEFIIKNGILRSLISFIKIAVIRLIKCKIHQCVFDDMP